MTRYDNQPHVKLTTETAATIHWQCHPHHLETAISSHHRDILCIVCLTLAPLPTTWQTTTSEWAYSITGSPTTGPRITNQHPNSPLHTAKRNAAKRRTATATPNNTNTTTLNTTTFK